MCVRPRDPPALHPRVAAAAASGRGGGRSRGRQQQESSDDEDRLQIDEEDLIEDEEDRKRWVLAEVLQQGVPGCCCAAAVAHLRCRAQQRQRERRRHAHGWRPQRACNPHACASPATPPRMPSPCLPRCLLVFLLLCSLAAMTELQREFVLAERADKRNAELLRQKLLKKVRCCCCGAAVVLLL